MLQDESCIAAHLGERAPKVADDESAAYERQDGSEDSIDQGVSLNNTTPCLFQPAYSQRGLKVQGSSAAQAVEQHLHFFCCSTACAASAPIGGTPVPKARKDYAAGHE